MGMVLSGGAIRRGVRDGRIGISPYDEGQIEAAHINLRLGDSDAMRDGVLVVQPAQFVLARTLEHITLPKNLCGHLEGRSKLAQLGLSIEQSSTFVEPGSDSTMVLEIYNVSSEAVRLERGKNVAKLILMQITDNF